MHSMKTNITFMEIEIYNDDYTEVTGAQITLFMAKCMNGPLYCDLKRASIQYDELIDWEALTQEEFAERIANIDSGFYFLPQKVRFEFSYQN